MVTVIDTLERKSDELARYSAWAAKLAAALAPDPAAWEYRDEVLDCAGEGAHCACGHPVRYLYPLYRGADTAAVGSECINHFAALAPGLHVKLAAAEDALRARIAAAKRQAKSAADSVEVAGLRAEFEAALQAAYDRYEAARVQGRRSPRVLWEVIASNRWRVPAHAPEYARACDLKRWYKTQTATLRAALVAE